MSMKTGILLFVTIVVWGTFMTFVFGSMTTRDFGILASVTFLNVIAYALVDEKVRA